MSLWTSEEITAAMGGQPYGEFEVSGISIDTRTLQPGDLFIALKGPHFDGHEFIDQAWQAGAAGFLSSKPLLDKPHILIPDTYAGLRALGVAARARTTAQVIAITGSVGKTTTRALAVAAFSSFSKVHASTGNLNNHLGVPLSLARMPRGAQTAIFEMGMNHFGEIEALSHLVRPHIGIITALDWVHSQNLDGTLEGVARAKAEICANLQGPLYAPIHLRELLTPYVPKDQVVTWIEHPFEGSLTLPGNENRWNAALALAPVPPNHRLVAQRAVGGVAPKAGRGRARVLTLDGKKISVLDDAYNAAPASMRAALTNLLARGGGRKIAVLGDMAELANPVEQHENLGKFLNQYPPHMLIAVGRFHQSILQAAPPSIPAMGFDDASQVMAYLRPRLQAGDQVLVKASNSTNLSIVVRELEHVAFNRVQ